MHIHDSLKESERKVSELLNWWEEVGLRSLLATFGLSLTLALVMWEMSCTL